MRKRGEFSQCSQTGILMEEAVVPSYKIAGLYGIYKYL